MCCSGHRLTASYLDPHRLQDVLQSNLRIGSNLSLPAFISALVSRQAVCPPGSSGCELGGPRKAGGVYTVGQGLPAPRLLKRRIHSYPRLQQTEAAAEFAETTGFFTEMSAATDAPGELSFISEHDTDSESSEPAVQKKKKKVKKKSESPAAPTTVRVTAVNTKASSSLGRKKTPKTTEEPLPKRGQTNEAFEPDFKT
ncbi:hypothetical protein MATL_G00202930 [Megalops atlanticus]|uniref:Uncharacterized protein n=1 Tax=Megalops atlanticus TaxID=7932 RepID=A0A9D3T482_MEGAT|nr:hypothetical protein MATL_G00202930 [Megalops atlanticus]